MNMSVRAFAMSNERPDRRGNSSRSTPRSDETMANEALWEARKKRSVHSQQPHVYEVADQMIDGLSINAEQLDLALTYLSAITGDEAFKTASAALQSYGLNKGGLQATTKRLLRSVGATPSHYAALRMHQKTTREAERVAAELGVPGPSFATVVRDVLQARADMEIRWSEGEELPSLSDGATGRSLLVRLGCLWFGGDNQPNNALFGIEFEADGFAVAPDDRNWRSEIAQGRVVSFGVLDGSDPRGEQRRKAWKILQAFPVRKNPE